MLGKKKREIINNIGPAETEPESDLGSSSRNKVVPWGLKEAHMRESWPRPKTRKLQGERERRTSNERVISSSVCWGTTGEVA